MPLVDLAADSATAPAAMSDKADTLREFVLGPYERDVDANAKGLDGCTGRGCKPAEEWRGRCRVRLVAGDRR